MTPYPKALERFPTIRQSRGVAFDACALSAKLDADYRAHWSGHPQVRGQIMHRVFAEALRTMVETGENGIPTDVMVGLLADALRQDDVDRECPDCGGAIIDATGGIIRCAQGHEFAGDFGNIPMAEIKDMRWVSVKWANDNTFDIEHLVDIEQRLKTPITYPDGEGGHVERMLTGQLDALFAPEPDHAVVLDWKDTWGLPAPTEVGFDGYAQQRWYAWLVMKNYPSVDRVTLREFYVRHSASREATVHRYELVDVEQELSALAERFDRAFQQNTYPPSPGRHCLYCAKPASCPIFPGVKGEGLITDEQTARRIAGEAIVAKAALQQREKALKAWADVRGAIPIRADAGRERVWGFVERKRISRPTREELEKHLYLGKKIDLDALYREQTVTRFEQHVPTAVEDTADDAKLMQALEDSLKQHEQEKAA